MPAYRNFVFPYNKVKQGSKVIIYGAGKAGQHYLQELRLTGFCSVLAIADKDWAQYDGMHMANLISPNSIPDYPYDCIVVAVDDDKIRRQICDNLQNKMHISAGRIIAEPCSHEFTYHVKSKVMASNLSKHMAYESKELSIAFFVGDGLGDIIIEKKLINYLLEIIYGDFYVDIYGKENFVKSILSDCKNLNNILPSNFYTSQRERYDLAINAMYILSVDRCNHQKMLPSNAVLSGIIDHLQYQVKEYGLAGANIPQVSSIHFLRCKYNGRNAYTAYNEPGGLQISDTHVDIPLTVEKVDKHGILDGRYITIHSGWGGLARRGRGHAKMWPQEHWQELLEAFKERFPSIGVVQLGDVVDAHIIGADEYMLGDDLEVVKHILKGSVLHIDNEGGLVHLATQIGTKCAVLFGPTPVWYFGYRQNINIVAKNCNSCCFLGQDFSVCIRGMEKPECMLSIKPQAVLHDIEPYLRKALC